MIGFVAFGELDFAWGQTARSLKGLVRGQNTKSVQVRRALDISSQAASREASPEIEIRLNDLVGEAVSQGLSHFGGDDVVESLIYILELEHSVNLRNIVNQVEEFRKGLTKMFGDAAYVVEGHVCSNLARTMGLDPEGRTLEELIETARSFVNESYEQNSKTL